MSFFDTISSFGSVREAAKKTYGKQDARSLFCRQAASQITSIRDGALDKKGRFRGHWFDVQPDQRVVVTLKFGVHPIRLSGNATEMVCDDPQAAIRFISAASNAARNGELDALFEDIKRSRKTSKTAAGECQ